MPVTNQILPWVSFCISTYKRPELLKQQIGLLLNQSDENFEIVISDNDEEGSAEPVINSFEDSRIRYFKNEENLGMIRSFNKSIERARTEYITMVTDDDPIDTSFLDAMSELIRQYPGYSLYGGFQRKGKSEGYIEKIDKCSFIAEILDPSKTPAILWSSCIMKRSDVIESGKIPEYGSPHLADHVLIVRAGSFNGGIIINKMYSSLTQHDNNFSKLNFETYVKGCKEFHANIIGFIIEKKLNNNSKAAVIKHLNTWFISSVFNLKRYYTIKGDKKMLSEVNDYAKRILSFSFMMNVRGKYLFKTCTLFLKKILGVLRVQLL